MRKALRSSALLAYGLSLSIHLGVLGLLRWIRVPLPTLSPFLPLEVTLMPAPAPRPGPPEDVGKRTQEELPLAETVLPEEVLAEEALKRLKAKEEAVEKRLFGSKHVGVKIEGILTQRRVIRHPLPPPLPLVHDQEIRLRVRVDRNGHVVDVEVLRRGTPEVERAAVEAVRKWRFEPLPRGVQEFQEGVIVFYFRLQPP